MAIYVKKISPSLWITSITRTDPNVTHISTFLDPLKVVVKITYQTHITKKRSSFKAADQEEKACKKHGFGQSLYGPEDHSWSHLLVLEEWPEEQIP